MTAWVALSLLGLQGPPTAAFAQPGPNFEGPNFGGPNALTGSRKLLRLIDRLREDDHWKARMEAAVMLGRSGDTRARRPLIGALADPHYNVRIAALRALTHLGDVRAVPAMIDLLGEEDAFVRLEAQRALERFRLPMIRPYLIHAIARHSDAQVRLGAAQQLTQSEHATAWSALLDATGDDKQISQFATSAIRARKESEAISLFLKGLKRSDYRVQIVSIDSLAEMGASQAVEPVIELLDSKVPEVTIAAGRGLRQLTEHIDKQKYFVRAMRSKNLFERARALKVLGFLGGEDAVKLLLNAMDDPDVLVRGAAVASIASIADTRAIPKLEKMRKREANARIISLVKKTLAYLRRVRDGTEDRPSFSARP